MQPIYPLLGLLARVERHGYDLKRWADIHLDPFWRIDFGQLYRTLQRAVRQGWIAPARHETSAHGPKRTLYRLTPAGREALAAWLDEPASDDDELMVKLRLAAEGVGRLDRIARRNRSVCDARLAAARDACHKAIEARDRGAILARDAVRRRCEAISATLALAQAAVRKPVAAPVAAGTLRIAGSDDPLLGWLAHEAGVASRVVGSYGGLWALQRHESDAASLHLLDPQTNEYNRPFLERFFPEGDLLLVNIAWRETGLMVARGNPKAISGVAALARDDVRFVNRQREAGTRLLLARRLREAGLDRRTIAGWERCVATHECVADAIVLGLADVGPGLRAIAAARGLDFLPLACERYDLAIARAVFTSNRCRRLRTLLRSRSFRDRGAQLPGYDLRDSGQVVGTAGSDHVEV